MADQQRSIVIYRQGVEDCRRSLFKSWLVATLVSAVVMAIVPGEKDWRTILATTGMGGNVGFVAYWLIDRAKNL